MMALLTLLQNSTPSVIMKIAVEGCCHGELDKIYETVQYLEQVNNIKVRILSQ